MHCCRKCIPTTNIHTSYLRHKLHRLTIGAVTHAANLLLHGDNDEMNAQTQDAVKQVRLGTNEISEVDENLLDKRRLANVIHAVRRRNGERGDHDRSWAPLYHIPVGENEICQRVRTERSGNGVF